MKTKSLITALTILSLSAGISAAQDEHSECCPAEESTTTIQPAAMTRRQPAPETGPLKAAPQASTDQLEEMMAKAPKGRLAVRAVQGTPDGPAVGATDIEIMLVHRGQIVHSEEAQLDEHGVVVVEDLPVAMDVMPVVRVNYAGVVYQGTGPTLSPANNEASMDVTVYETTSEKPDWILAMRHLRAQPTENGLVVNETVVAENPAKTTWLGEGEDPEHLTTVRFQLPEGAGNVQLLGGFHGWCCTTFENGELAVQMPLMPGRSSPFQFAYTTPASEGKAVLSISAPVPTSNMVAFAPEDGTEIELTGFEYSDTQAMGDTSFRIYQASEIGAGEPVALAFTGIASPAAATTALASDTTGTAKIVAGVGIALLCIAGVAVLLIRSPKKEAAPQT